MIIKNGLVLGEDVTFSKRDLYISSAHRIIPEPEGGDENIVDAQGLYVLPGLVDVHIHGAMGCDFCDGSAEGLSQIASYLHACGVTSFCPTSMTLPEQQLSDIFKTVTEVPEDSGHSHIPGIHMEGPFLSSAKKGAQKESHLHHPDSEMFRRLNRVCGEKIRLVTIAPELPGAYEFILELHNETSISLGHSTASYDTAYKAFQAGANHVTHLFNAMPPFLHRDPGIIGAAVDSEHVMAELICDGIHIHPSVIRSAFQLFGDDRIILISDAMRATGMADGEYELGGQMVTKKGRRAALADGTIAGSATNLFDCMRNAVSFGIPLPSAVKAASFNPAKSIGAERSIGSLACGLEADVLLADKNLQLVRVI